MQHACFSSYVGRLVDLALTTDGLEAIAIVLDARIRDGHEPDFLVTGADVGHVDTKLLQAAFQLFDGEIVLV